MSQASQVWDLVTNRPLISVLVALCSTALYVYIQRPKLDHVPIVGSNGVMSYVDGYRSMLYGAQHLMHEGYHKFKGGAFRISFPDRWQVILTSPEMINEMRLAKDQDLSFVQATADTFQTKYTIGEQTITDTYHVAVIRTPLTRNLGTKFDEVYDEIAQAFTDLIPANEKEWMPVTILPVMQEVVCRTSNRLFFGLPVCREPEWVKLNIQYTIDAFTGAFIINHFPKFLKPLAGRLFSPISKGVQVGRKHLGAEIKERIRMDDEFGKAYEGRPNDLISWLLDYASAEERTVDRLIVRTLNINVAAIHTSASSFTQALFNLAIHPEYTAPMREEVIRVTELDGWTKVAMSKMRKVDSFLKESARFEGLSGVMMHRKVTNPAGFTFSSGLHLPHNTVVGAATFGIHHDSEIYDNPYVFDGFRFSNIRNDEGEGAKHQMVATSLEYLNFGHGRNACPGRFFAANELKTMLAHILVTYDIVLEKGMKPNSSWFGEDITPSTKARLMFRRLKV